MTFTEHKRWGNGVHALIRYVRASIARCPSGDRHTSSQYHARHNMATSKPVGQSGSGVLAPGSRIMGLKFMQRRQAKPGEAPAPAAAAPATSPAAAVGKQQPAVEPQVKHSELEWTLAVPDTAAVGNSAPPPPRVLLDEDAPTVGPTAALLQFRAGRRSFGSFNPRLEKRLAEIKTNQRAAADELAEAARAEQESRRRQEEHAELVHRAEADEAVERQNAVSDAELAGHFAARYGRYVPPPRPAAAAPRLAAAAPVIQPPEADHPVQVSDAPIRRVGMGPRHRDNDHETGGAPSSKKVRR